MGRPDDDDAAEVDDLVVDLDALRTMPHRLRCELSPAWISGRLAGTDATTPRAGEVDVEIDVQGDGRVLVRGALTAGYHVPCARCLAEAVVDASGPICLTFVPRAGMREWVGEGEDDDGLELAADDLDQIAYDGRVIDLRDAVAEQVLLAYPIRALCARGEACRGLCGGCGHDLNEVPAGGSACPECGRPIAGGDGATAENPAPSAWRAALGKIKL